MPFVCRAGTIRITGLPFDPASFVTDKVRNALSTICSVNMLTGTVPVLDQTLDEATAAIMSISSKKKKKKSNKKKKKASGGGGGEAADDGDDDAGT